MRIELPHTPGCLVCGRDNPHGLHLSFQVDPDAAGGNVYCDFKLEPHHIGFQGVIHGGVIATVLDEAMVWAATWSGRRFCLCAELNVRFRQMAVVGQPLRLEARVDFAKPRLIQTSAEIRNLANVPIAAGTGKYIPMPPERHHEVVAMFVPDEATEQAAEHLRKG